MSAKSSASAVQQEYLAEAYRLFQYQPDEPYITTSALAERMGVSAPAVAAVVERLKRAGLVEHKPYQGMRLTPKGEREALMNIRRHRLAEVFLVKVMGFGWHEVHDEASRISGALSETLVARMAEMAGSPTCCPHGEPIPSADGVIEPARDFLLSAGHEGEHYTISRVLTRETDRLEYIAALGLLPGTALQLLHLAPFHGPLQLKVGEEYRIIGHNLAELIKVLPLEQP